jgi:anti-sigma factor RsiW
MSKEQMDPMDPIDPLHSQCTPYAGALAELALGTLSGRERADVLEHVDSCPRCAEEVEQLSHTLDSLLQIAPDAEPPLGFEVRLFQRLGLERPHRRHIVPLRTRRGRHTVFAAAAALLVLAGVTAGHFLTTGSSSRPAPAAAATLEGVLRGPAGATLGQVVVAGKPAWLYMYVAGSHLPDRMRCEVRLTDGKTVVLGTFWSQSGHAMWSAPISIQASELAGARIVSSTGATIATAHLVTA